MPASDYVSGAAGAVRNPYADFLAKHGISEEEFNAIYKKAAAGKLGDDATGYQAWTWLQDPRNKMSLNMVNALAAGQSHVRNAKAAPKPQTAAERLRQIGESLMQEPGPDDAVFNTLSNLGGQRAREQLARRGGFRMDSGDTGAITEQGRIAQTLPYLTARQARGIEAINASHNADLGDARLKLAQENAQRGWDQEEFAGRQNEGAGIGSVIGGVIGAIPGIIAAPFTGGASLGLAGVGAGIGAGIGKATAGQPVYRTYGGGSGGNGGSWSGGY